MGTVYEAIDRERGAVVALKTPRACMPLGALPRGPTSSRTSSRRPERPSVAVTLAAPARDPDRRRAGDVFNPMLDLGGDALLLTCEYDNPTDDHVTFGVGY